MPLTPGTKLGSYEIVSPIGAGGMGEVYKANDTRLDRTVALKVLPSELSDNDELQKRFQQEARAISRLNHPHICTLYDVGSDNGIDFLVMEYLEGETLYDLLKKGPLPLAQVLRYGIEISGALDKAHGQEVVHRDVKPGNIIITKDGAMLLDFGLATRLRQSSGGARAHDDSSLPTKAKPLTEKGTILGTVQYMAPEQLEGKEADTRTDIFAFGALLYEMVTGKKAFEGESQASLITAIMSAQPQPPSQHVPTSPPLLDHIIQTCLAKDPDDRWQSVADVSRDLTWLVRRSESDDDTRSPGSAPRGRALALAALLGALVAGATVWVGKNASPIALGSVSSLTTS